MKLEVLLPWRVFLESIEVSRIVAETGAGSFGLWPHRLDCVAALVPGILTYETESGREIFLAVDEGMLIKTGAAGRGVGASRAWPEKNLESLRQDGGAGFLGRDEHEQGMRSVMAGLESGFTAPTLRSSSMNKAPDERGGKDESDFVRLVGAKAVRMRKARDNPAPGIGFGLGMMGLIGWSVVAPTVLGAMLGMWLDGKFPRAHSWTLALLVGGLVLGCANAWHWVSRQDQAGREESRHADE